MRNSRFTPLHRAIALLTFLFSMMTFAQAQTFLGTAGDHLWSNEDNWLDGLKPTGMFSEVTISSDVIVDEDVSIGTLNNAGHYSLTILSGKILMVNTAIYWGDSDFILEDNARLVHSNPIQVTIKKNISAHNDDNHLWDLISSPVREDVIPSTENGILTDPETAFALYSFDDNTTNWINYKEDPFVIENGKSYLYANAFDTTLIFEGTTVGSYAECNLSYHAGNGAYAGCNFIGNPLPCEAFLNRSYYVLSDESNSLIAVPNSATRSVAPCSGIIVNSNGLDDSEVLFDYMPFFQYLGHQGYIEITVAKSEAPTEISNNDLDYLHLIDNMTGDNIDLLTTPNYSFSAKTTDYASRFKLVFDPHYGIEEDGPSTGSGTFAYYANGEIIINDVETCHGASLQMVDMTGRTVWSETINNRDGVHTVSTMSPGIYVLRLNDGNTIRTQKMVIP